MEMQIQDLVSSIKKDGIDAANREAAAILEDAKKQADSIVAAAKNEASALKEKTEKEVKVFEESAKLSSEQARRDAMLAFKTEVQAAFEKLLAADVSKALDDSTLAGLIKTALAGEDVSCYAAELESVSEGLKAQLAEEIRGGLELKVSKNAGAGFRLAAKDGSGYFDCSDDAIMEMLMPYFRDIHF